MDDPFDDALDLDGLEAELEEDDSSAVLYVDDSLTALERWHRYITSPHELHRLFTVKLLEDAVSENEAAVIETDLLPLVEQVANEEDSPTIRRELAEQLGTSAVILWGKKPESLTHNMVISTYLNLVASLIVDDHEDVRKEAEKTLISISKLLSVTDLGSHVLAIVLGLAHSQDDEDHRVSAIGLLASLAEMLGPALCATYAVTEIGTLAHDPAFRVRRGCAEALVAVAGVAKDAQEGLMDIWVDVARDPIWSVRKGCADVMADFAGHCHEHTRGGKPLELCLEFLRDESNWVKKAAQTKLGEFISVLPPNEIPEELINQYRVMIEPTDYGQNEAELPCAFSLPAVAQSLGAERWGELNSVFTQLQCSNQWQVRKTLAYSIHALAGILGPQMTEAMLLPAFLEFANDLPEVRAGIYNSIEIFTGMIPSHAKHQVLPVLKKMRSDYPQIEHWRMRLTLAEKLPQLTPLFEADVVFNELWPLCSFLCNDNVSEVRYAAAAVPGRVLLQMHQSGNSQWMTTLTNEIVEMGHARTWVPRQTFCDICGELLKLPAAEELVAQILPVFCELASDPVPNVRIALARALAGDVVISAANRDYVSKCVDVISKDKDSDVLYWASRAKQ